MKKIEKNGLRVYEYPDNTRLVSVTTAIKATQGGDAMDALMFWASKNPNYKQISQNSMHFGSFLHNKIEKVLNGHAIEGDFDREIEKLYLKNVPYSGYLAYLAVVNFIRDSFIVEKVEMHVKSQSLYMAGTIDLLAVNKKENRLFLIDYKFSPKIKQYREHFLQLAAYREILKDMGINVDVCANLFYDREKNSATCLPLHPGAVSRREIEAIGILADERIIKNKKI